MEPTRLFDIMALQAAERPRPDALATKINGAWQKISSADVLATADALSQGLASLGIGRGDRVALISMNRPEWAYVDLAVLQLGAVVVPIYPTSTASDYEYILAHSEAKVAFVAGRSILEKIQTAQPKLPKLTDVFEFDKVAGVRHWQEVVELGKKSGDKAALDKAKAAVAPGDLASLIYTSGTTGTPKGVMLTHANLIANVLGIAQVIPATGIQRALSFLPLSHVLERTVSYFYQYKSISIYYAESIDAVAANLKEVRPHVFVTVPRLLEKVYEGITAKGKTLTGVKRRLFDWALALGLAHDPDRLQGPVAALKLAVARTLVFKKWQEALGGELKIVVVGGSALQPRLGRVFYAAGLTVLEGYGLTETAPVISVNSPDAHRLGTVGKPLPNVTVKIAPEEGYGDGEGEILAKGPSIMPAYLNNPEATREAIDADGFFHTGDIGRLEKGGYLRITDRKKEMFKTSGGKYIAPLALENKLLESPYVAQVIIVGENRKFPSALVVPEQKALGRWCQENGVPFPSIDAAAASEPIKTLFSNEIQRLNQGFGQWERVKAFRLVADEWTVAAGELTPKLSLRRKVIQTKHKDLIEDIYRGC